MGAGRLDNPFEELKEIKQRGSVDDYIEEFEAFSSQCGRPPKRQFLGYFVGGLKREIKNRVRTLKPKNRYQAMQLARDIEAELMPDEDDDEVRGKKGVYGLYTRQPKSYSAVKWTTGLGASSGSGQPASSSKPGGFFSIGSKSHATSTNGPASNTMARHPSSSTQTIAKRPGMDQRMTGKRDRGLRHVPYAELVERKAKGLF